MLEKTTKIIVTVDDFGPSTEVNERTFEAFAAGSITRVSAIVNIPWPAGAWEMLRKKKIPVGLHLNISSGSPLSSADRIPSLVDAEGKFLAENKSHNLSHIHPAEISEEFKSQLGYFLAMGWTLSHLDNHRPEIYFFPELLAGAVHIASEEKVTFRHPLRNFSAEDIGLMAGKLRCSAEDISQLKTSYDDALAKKGVRCADYFLSDTSCGGFEGALEVIARKNMPGTCEIAVHLEGEMGKSNLAFMLSDRFRTEIVKAE